MGECGTGMQIERCATSVADDMSVARDIARRFEQLETQWLSFQKKSAKWEAEKDVPQKGTTNFPPNRSQEHPVSSAASSYSNPLFANHTSLVRSGQISDRASSASSRTGSPSALNSGRTPFSSRHRGPAAIATSGKDVNVLKDDHSSSLVYQSVAQVTTSSLSMPSSPLESSGRTSKGGQISPSSDAMYTRATVPIVYRDKPPLNPAASTDSKSPSGHEKHVSCASLTRLPPYRKSEPVMEFDNNLNLQDIFGEVCPPPSSNPNLSSREYSTNSVEVVESCNPTSSDPATYSSGKGPPESSLSSLEATNMLGAAHYDQSRSPPSAAPTFTAKEELQLNTSSYKAPPPRNVAWRVLANRSILTEGVLKHNSHPSENCSETSQLLAYEMPTYNANELTSMKGNVLKLEVQIDKNDNLEADNMKLGDRLCRVNWELRLSKREAALRIAEEKLLEEQQKLSQERLAINRCEDALSHREHDGQREKERQNSDLAEKLKSIETGKTVMRKLCAALKDVLWQLEKKDKVLQNAWLELRESVDLGSYSGDHSFGFEPEVSQKDRKSATFDGMAFLAAEGKCEEWCSTVIGICERLVTYMSRETHLQKWGTVLEKEGTRMSKMQEEMAKEKEAASEQCSKAEAMMKCAEEQASSLEDERVKLAKERDNLILWVTHLQERRKAVAECEREAAASMAEVQKKAADLFVHESNIDGRALEISALQEELRLTSQRLHDDQEQMNREKQKVQDRLKQIAARERETDSKNSALKKLQEEVKTKADQLEKNRSIEEKKKAKLLSTLKETEAKISAKEVFLQELEKELKRQGAAVDEKTNNLDEREKRINGLQRQLEQERSKIRQLFAGLERDKLRMKEAEEAISDAHIAKKSAEDAWARTAKERRESAEYLKSVEERVRKWEDRLRDKEKELQMQQKNLQQIEDRAREEKEQSEALHAKLMQEQETWSQELKAKQESLTSRYKKLEAKEEEIKADLEKLAEERRVVHEEINRLAEMEARAWATERDLQVKHDAHIKEVRNHAKEYHAQLGDLEIAKREVDKELHEVHAKKMELQIWQREAEETLQNRIDSFVKGKEELTAQIQELRKLQVDIEQAGSQIIDRVAELDQASTRLERQRHKVETSKGKLEVLADKLSTHQEVLKRRENEFLTQETKLVAVQSGLKRMAAEAASKEKNLRFREHAVIHSEKDLQELESRLASEKKDLDKMIAEVEQHAETLKEETAIVEESNRNRTHDELLMEERREQLEAKERELESFGADLKNKAKSLEEHGQTMSKLETQVKERLQRAADLETKSSELEKGLEGSLHLKKWEQLKEGQANLDFEKESLKIAKTEIQRVAANQRIECIQMQVTQEQQEKDDNEKKVLLKEEMEKQRTEMMDILRAREASIDARETNVSDRESTVLKLERQTKDYKDQVEKDAQALRQQLQGARAELEDQRRNVEEKRKAAEAIASTIEEREARLRLKEREMERRGSFPLKPQQQNQPKPLENGHRHEIGDAADYRLRTQVLGLRVSDLEDSVQAEMLQWVSKSAKGTDRLAGFENGSQELRAQSTLVHKQSDNAMEERLKQMEDTIQKEAAKISQERTNLKLQQEDLEETRKAVQEVKMTLTAQLKATKLMVSDASLTAQNASREREALEEERKRLTAAQKDAEACVAAKEAKLAKEAKQLETMKNMLDQEKAQAMEMIQQAAKRAVDAERAKAGTSSGQWESNMMNKEIQCDANLKEREREITSTTEAIRRQKTDLTKERAQVKMLHDALEREQIEHSHASMKHAVKADNVLKDAENRMAWEEIKKRREKARVIGEAHGWRPKFEMSSNERSNANEQDFSFSALEGGLESSSHDGGIGKGSSKTPKGYHHWHPDHNTVTNDNWDEPFGPTMLISSPTLSLETSTQITPGKLVGDSCAHIHEGNGAPSRKRLENVMTSLMHAREASRSRLQRTEHALLSFPPSAGFTSQVQQALNALSARLSLMEQIEEGLASHLQNAYENESQDPEGMIIDKVQLLCRMEEQQSLRSEWEEDMQRQLETISMLQASSRNSSTYNTPMKLPNQGAPTGTDQWQGSSNYISQGGGKGHVSYELSGRSGVNVVEADLNSRLAGGSRPPNQYTSPNWTSTFEPLQGVDSKGLSYSPLVEYNNYVNSPRNNHSLEFGTHEVDNHERNTRRKLQLSPTQMHYG